MTTTIQTILAAAVLLTACASGAVAAEPAAANSGATSVSEMMQRKHLHKLRARLVAEGRTDEVRRLDESNAARLREEQENRYTKANEAIGRGSHAKRNGDLEMLNDCEPEKLRL